MHILLIIHSLDGGGAERVTAQMAEYWYHKGHEITVVTIASADNNRYELPAGIEYLTLDIKKKSSGPISGLFNILSRILTVRRAVINKNPDVVISMMSQLSIVTGLACINITAKCIGSERVYPGNFKVNRAWRFLRKFAYQFVDTVVVQTVITKQWMHDNTNAKRVAVIPNSLHLPLPSLHPVLNPQKSTDEKWVLGVGRLTSQKQFDHLIKTFAALADEFPEWNLVIVGEGDSRVYLEQLITQLKLEKRVFLKGRAGNISKWYEAADVFALTSMSEGFPNALIEAMAHGLPCVSYDCLTGPGEVIKTGENGILVDVGDEDALFTALRQVLKSKALREELSRKSTSIIRELQPDVIMAKWENEINLLIDK